MDENEKVVIVIMIVMLVLGAFFGSITSNMIETAIGENTCTPYQPIGVVEGYAVCNAPEGPFLKERK